MPNITLKRFMIFNSSEGHDESREGDKLLFHWTKEATDFKVSRTEQIDDICLCDASVNVSYRLNCDIGHFRGQDADSSELPMQQSSSQDSTTNSRESNKATGENFLPNKHGKSLVLTFEQTLVIIVEVEPKLSIWMAAHVSPPSSVDAGGNSNVVTGQQATILSTNQQQQQQMDPNCIPADAIERVMINIYARFCLLNGTFDMIAEQVEQSIPTTSDDYNNERRKSVIRDRMRSICEQYFSDVLPDIHLNSIISNIASLYNYILYLDLNPLTLMKVNSFINHLVSINAAQIRHTIVIFNDQLLWSSLNMHDSRLLYNYLVSVLIRDALQEELSREVDKVRRIKENLPIYLTDISSSAECSYLNEAAQSDLTSPNMTDSDGLSRQNKLTKLYLTVFRSSNNMTLGLIFSEPNLTNLTQKCEQVLTSDSRLGVIPLASLAQSVGQNFLRANSQLHHQQAQHLPSSSQQQATGTTAVATISAASSLSSSNWRRPSAGHSTLKNAISNEQKYVFMDRLDVSISWPLSMDMQNKEHLLLGANDNSGLEFQSSSNHNKKLRLIKYLIELEPELYDIKRESSSSVEEFFGRTFSDSWLTVTNSKYRTIYSVHNVRNSGLSEAQQSAFNLRSIFSRNRRP